MSTLHRRDITGADFNRLAKFCAALLKLMGPNSLLPWALGEVMMRLPVWCLFGSEWRLANYKEYRREALGIMVSDFRRVCRYIGVSEFQMVDTLFRLSMISVVKGQRLSESPRFKMDFCGVPVSLQGCAPETDAFGYVIERRRADGGFRQR